MTEAGYIVKSVADLTEDELNWAVAFCEGDYLGGEPQPASNADIEHLELPFYLYDLKYHWGPDGDFEHLQGVEVRKVKVTRYGIAPGCSAPTIDVTDEYGGKSQSSADCYFLTEDIATAAGRYQMSCDKPRYTENPAALLRIIAEEGIALRQYRPSTHQELDVRHFDAAQGDVIRYSTACKRDMVYRPNPPSENNGLWYAKRSNGLSMIQWSKQDYTGSTPALAVLRCYVGLKHGATIEVPTVIPEQFTLRCDIPFGD